MDLDNSGKILSYRPPQAEQSSANKKKDENFDRETNESASQKLRRANMQKAEKTYLELSKYNPNDCSKLTKEIEMLKEELNNVTDSKIRGDVKFETLIRQLETLKLEAKKSNDRISELHSTKVEAQKENMALKDKLKELEGKSLASTLKIAGQERIMEELKFDLDHKEREFVTLRRQFEACKAENLELTHKLDSESDECHSLQSKVNRLSNELHSVQSRFEAYKAAEDEEADRLRMKYTSKLKEYQACADSDLSRLANMEKVKDSVLQENDELRKKLNSFSSENVQLKQSAKTFEEKYEIAAQSLDELESLNMDMQFKVTKATRESSELKESHTSLNERVEKLRNENIQLLASVDDKSEKIAEYKNLWNASETKFIALEDGVECLESEMQMLKEYNDELMSTLSAKESELEMANKRLLKAKKDHDEEIMHNTAQHKRELERLQDRIADLTDENEGHLEGVVRSHETRTKRIRMQLEEVSDENSKLNDELDFIKDSMINMQESLAKERETNLNLRNDKKVLEEKLTNIGSEMTTLKTRKSNEEISDQEELEKLKQKVTELQMENSNLSKENKTLDLDLIAMHTDLGEAVSMKTLAENSYKEILQKFTQQSKRLNEEMNEKDKLELQCTELEQKIDKKKDYEVGQKVSLNWESRLTKQRLECRVKELEKEVEFHSNKRKELAACNRKNERISRQLQTELEEERRKIKDMNYANEKMQSRLDTYRQQVKESSSGLNEGSAYHQYSDYSSLQHDLDSQRMRNSLISPVSRHRQFPIAKGYLSLRSSFSKI